MEQIKYKLMYSLADLDLQVWNREPLFSGMVGRHVYMCMAKELIAFEGAVLKRSLKQIFQHPELTDRAVRLKLRELEVQGFIEIDICQSDKRVRSLKPTNKLINLYEGHAEKGVEIIAKHFYLIEKLNDKSSN